MGQEGIYVGIDVAKAKLGFTLFKPRRQANL